MPDWTVYFLAYLIAGFTLKLGDDLLDELERPHLAWYPFALSGVLFGFIMTISEWDFVLMTSILIAVIISGKVNRLQYIVGFVLIIVTIALFGGIPGSADWISWFAILIILFLAAVLDEKGNDWSDQERSPVAYWLFNYRFTLKIVAVCLVIPWPMFFATAIGLWVFDCGYELAGWSVRKIIIS